MDAPTWSPDEIAQRIRLAYGATRAGTPRTRPLATLLGVTPRTLQRWLSGTNRPSPAHLSALRDALSPTPELLARQQQEARWAAAAAAAMAVPGGRGLDPHWARQAWHRPHRLYLLTHPLLALTRPVIALENRAKPEPSGGAWRREDVVTLPHRPAAVLVRAALLEEVQQWRTLVNPQLVSRHSMCWLTPPAQPLLGALAYAAGWRE